MSPRIPYRLNIALRLVLSWFRLTRVHKRTISCTNHVSGDIRYTIEASPVPNLSFGLKTEGWSREPYGSEREPGTDITLITSVVAADSLNLAETHSPVGSHLDKSDNLHLNGDYHKMLACSHSTYLLLGNWENNRPCCSTPSVWDNNKKASIPFREKMLAYSFFS